MKTKFSVDFHSSKSFRCARTAFAAALGLMAAAAIGLPASTALAAPAVVIKMQDKPPKYLPEKATIKVGQTVQWVNDAKTLHSVTFDPASAQKKGDVQLPAGVKPFDSGFMQPEATYDHTFQVPGTYKYTCLPHEKDGMDGYIVVKK